MPGASGATEVPGRRSQQEEKDVEPCPAHIGRRCGVVGGGGGVARSRAGPPGRRTRTARGLGRPRRQTAGGLADHRDEIRSAPDLALGHSGAHGRRRRRVLRRRPAPGPAAAAKDGRTFRLALQGVELGPAKDLQVRAAGRRLDEAGATGGLATATLPGAGEAVGPATGQLRRPRQAGPVPHGHRRVRPRSGEAARLPRAGRDAGRGRRTARAPPASARSRCSCTAATPPASSRAAPRTTLTGDWPCPTGTQPIPSHRGYLQDQKLLASQGYVTVSISANGINGQDCGRRGRRRAGPLLAGTAAPRQVGRLGRAPDGTAHRRSCPNAAQGRPVPRPARRPLAGRRGRQPGRHGQPLPAARRAGRLPGPGALEDPRHRPHRPDDLRPEPGRRRAVDDDPARLRRRRLRPPGRDVRRRDARGQPGHRPAQRRLRGRRQPQLLQHRVDAGPVRGARLRRLLGRPGGASPTRCAPRAPRPG